MKIFFHSSFFIFVNRVFQELFFPVRVGHQEYILWNFNSYTPGKSGGMRLQPSMQTPLHNPEYQWPGSHSASH